MNPLLLPLSAAFRAGVAMRHAAYNRGWFKIRRLKHPVVSVGNLTAGGTGKTPLVAYIAGMLARRGWRPAILTRGYGRKSKEELIVVAPADDRRLDPREVGDEPALLARALPQVPLVICADRFRGGHVAEEQFKVDVHILDDGFQHLALAREVNVLVLDATQPLSNWGLLPAGRQREPLSALRRAHIVVVTRTEMASPLPLRRLTSQVHPRAEVFDSQTELLGWIDAASGEVHIMEGKRSQKAAAFCGIGNPAAFFADLRRWGLDLIAEDAFPDHHIYTDEEIKRLAANAGRKGAAALLTTPKDAIKLPRGWTPPMPILACETKARIEDGARFETTLLAYLEKGR